MKEESNELQNIKEVMYRSHVRVCIKWMESEEGRKLIAKANKYKIPYEKDPIKTDWLTLKDEVNKKLRNQIAGYEFLILQAAKNNIDWDFSIYDPIGLEQAIKDENHKEMRRNRALLTDYLGSILA